MTMDLVSAQTINHFLADADLKIAVDTLFEKKVDGE